MAVCWDHTTFAGFRKEFIPDFWISKANRVHWYMSPSPVPITRQLTHSTAPQLRPEQRTTAPQRYAPDITRLTTVRSPSIRMDPILKLSVTNPCKDSSVARW